MSDLRAELNRLAMRAHERELSNALLELFGKFDQWRRGALDPFALDEQIREHASGVAPDLKARYSGPSENALAMAVVSGVLAEADLSDDVLAAIGPQVNYLRDKLGGAAR